MVPYNVQLSVSFKSSVRFIRTLTHSRFPLDVVFRIYDNVLASGVESIFGFSVVLLQKNEESLLRLKFDDILAFLKNRLFQDYIVRFKLLLLIICLSSLLSYPMPFYRQGETDCQSHLATKTTV